MRSGRRGRRGDHTGRLGALPFYCTLRYSRDTRCTSSAAVREPPPPPPRPRTGPHETDVGLRRGGKRRIRGGCPVPERCHVERSPPAPPASAVQQHRERSSPARRGLPSTPRPPPRSRPGSPGSAREGAGSGRGAARRGSERGRAGRGGPAPPQRRLPAPLTAFMAEAMSSYLSACSARRARCSSCSRSPMAASVVAAGPGRAMGEGGRCLAGSATVGYRWRRALRDRCRAATARSRPSAACAASVRHLPGRLQPRAAPAPPRLRSVRAAGGGAGRGPARGGGAAAPPRSISR